MLRRIFVYLNETFKLPSRLALTVINAYIVSLFLSNQFQLKHFVVASLGMFFSLLYYRICDEFKDVETDRIFFPERPLPSGRVKVQDLKYLQYFSMAVMVSLLGIDSPSRCFTLFLIIDCLLMQFWFFMPNLMENNRLIAFATHSPYAFVVNLFLIGVYTEGDWSLILTLESVALIMCLSLPGFHWEVIRKTFVRDRAGYQTYSSILTYQGAILLSLIFFFPLLFFLYILLETKFFTPLAVMIIFYSVYLWGLGLKNKKSLIPLQTLAEMLSTMIVIFMIIQGYSYS